MKVRVWSRQTTMLLDEVLRRLDNPPCCLGTNPQRHSSTDVTAHYTISDERA